MKPIFRPVTRGLWPVLPLLLLSTAVSAQSGSPFEFDSAVDSHRRLNDDRAPPSPGADAEDTVVREDRSLDPEAGTESAAQEETGAKPAGDRPAPIDPAQAMAPDADERTTVPLVREPSLRHDSALEGYAGYDESNAPGWGEANDRVGEIGGWREYAKELYTPAPEPVSAESESTPEPEMGSAETRPATAAKPAGDRPMPVDPAKAIAPENGERESAPSVSKATLEHDSVLADYARYEESDGPNWIEANERVGEIGGWREYAKELYEPAPTTSDDGGER